MVNNSRSTCRICLNECNKKILIFEEENGTRYSDLIKEYTGIELIKKDNLPTGLCKECESEIMTVIKFISKVTLTNEKLQEILKWDVPLIYSNSLVKEEKALISYSVKSEDENYFESQDFVASDDSEAEISLQVLKTKKYNKKHRENEVKEDVKNEENSDIFNDDVSIKNDYDEKTADTNNLEKDIENPGDSRCVVLKKSEHGLKKDMIKCLTCGILSINKSAFIVHFRKHTGEKPHKCGHCKMRYSQVGTLNAHIRKRHPKEWNKMKTKANKLKQLREIERLKIFSMEPNMKEETVDEKPRPRVTCDICGKSYYHKYALNVHMRVHNVDKQVKCPYCPQRFVQTGDRLLHIRVHHTFEKPYCCHFCGKAFASGTNLRVHLLSHSEERKFKCEICNKGMKTKDNLKRHMLVMHTATKGKVCHICGKAYALTYKLNNHMKVWHMRAGECNICKKNYKNIESHMKTHSPDKAKADKQFKCQMCHKSFNKQKNLMEHIKKHQNENAAFKCTYENCNSAFAKKCVLDFHVLKYHLKHTPYVCQYCNRGFYRKGDLGQHLKSSHNIKREYTLPVEYECELK